MSRRRATAIGLAALTVVVAGPIAAGQDASWRDERVDVAALIAELESPDFVDRELASHALQNLNTVTLADLEAALTVDELTLEQRRRVSAAARMRFLTEPRAAMGINLGQITDLGLPITGTTRGFDSTTKLRAGDIITSIDGLEIRSLRDLQVSIIANAPGTVVPVRFLRDGGAMETALELGAWRDLPQASSRPQIEVLEMAWRHRSRAYRSLTEPETVPTLGEPVAGEPSGRPGGSRRGIRRDKVIAGGEARDSAARAVGVNVNRRLSAQLDERGADFAGLVAATLRDLESRAQRQRDRMARFELDVQRAKQRNDARALAELQDRLTVLQGELEIIEAQITRYQRMLEEQRDR